MYFRLVLGRRLEPKCRSGLDQLRAKWGVDASLPTLISQDRKVLPEPTRAFPGNHNHSAHQEKNAVLKWIYWCTSKNRIMLDILRCDE